MGFVEEMGVAQYYRDARILPIYEGTNGIQAIDLVTRKLNLDGGRALSDMLDACQEALSAFAGNSIAMQLVAQMQTLTMQLRGLGDADKLAAASPYTSALAAFVAASYLAKASEIAKGSELQSEAQTDARYFIAVELPTALAAAQAAIDGANLVTSANFG
jgi:acyl-CoA dehydrogenase